MIKDWIESESKLKFLKKSLLIYFILLLIFFSLFFVVHAIALTLITIPREVSVSNKFIELSDIAKIDSDNPEMLKKVKDVELGIAPSPGEKKVIDTSYIVLRMKKEGIDPENFELECGDHVVVNRICKTLSKEELSIIVRDLLSKYLGIKNNKIHIENLSGIEDITIPEGKIEYKLDIRRNIEKYGRIIGNLDVIVDGEIYQKVWIQAKVSFYRNIAVINKNLIKGGFVSKADMDFEEELITDTSKNYITTPEQLNGLVASKNLKKGTILDLEQFSKPIMVNRGEDVLVEVDIKSLKISAMGTALENGCMGDVIKVRNNPSKKILTGRVISKGKVIIE
jgi:flagellar basal body P-ring formation protein FlgA